MQAKSYGKAGEGYNQDKDGDALLTQILYQDEMTFGGRWQAPAWMRAWLGLQIGGSAPATPESEPATAPRPAHRPKGDQEKQLRKLHRYLELRAFESDDRIYYFVDDIADHLRVSHRTAQNYLHILERNGEIERDPHRSGQGGRASLTLTAAFWGANNSTEAPEIAADPELIRGANEIAPERIATPQTINFAPQCIVDHQDLGAPTPPPLVADHLHIVTAAERAAVALEEQVKRDAEALARCWGHWTKDGEWVLKQAGSKRREPTRQRTVQREIHERRAAAEERARRIERLSHRVQQEWTAGHKPIKRSERLARLIQEHDDDQVVRISAPTPYHEPPHVPDEPLPSSLAPAGAQHLGDPLRGGPQAAEAPPVAADAIARLKARKAEVRQ